MAKVLVIPDTHARDFWKKAKDLINDYEKVIFLGDYVDPYSQEFPNLTHKELQEKTIADFKDIIAFAKQYPDKVVLLDGNHLLHYADKEFRCSRFDYELYLQLHDLYNQNNTLFKPAYMIDDVLFTHAGVTKEWVDYVSEHRPIKYENNPVEFIHQCDFTSLMAASRYRGGWNRYSGPEWLDVHELNYLTPLPGYFQVFGHTNIGYSDQPWVTDEYACVDNQKLYELDTETHKLTIV